MIVIAILSAVVTLCYGLCAINNMSRETSIGMRLSWIALTTGAAGILAAPFFGQYHPGVVDTTLHVGICLHVLFERRRGAKRLFK